MPPEAGRGSPPPHSIIYGIASIKGIGRVWAGGRSSLQSDPQRIWGYFIQAAYLRKQQGGKGRTPEMKKPGYMRTGAATTTGRSIQGDSGGMSDNRNTP